MPPDGAMSAKGGKSEYGNNALAPESEESAEVIQRAGFTESEHLLIGTNDGYAYNGYWKRQK